MTTPLVAEMVNAAADSLAEIRGRVSNVRYAAGPDYAITFELDGQQYRGLLRGRNLNAVLIGDERDAALAVRTILDGHAMNTAEIAAAGRARHEAERAAAIVETVEQVDAAELRAGDIIQTLGWRVIIGPVTHGRNGVARFACYSAPNDAHPISIDLEGRELNLSRASRETATNQREWYAERLAALRESWRAAA